MGVKIRTPRRRTIRLTGVPTRDGKFVLFDRDGNRVGLVDAAAAEPAGTVGLSRIAWDAAIDRMLARFMRQLGKRPHASMDDWEKKIYTWLKTQQDPVRARDYSRYFSKARRPTWDHAFKCMRNQFTNANRKLAFTEDLWMRWAETKRRNSERREAERGGKNSAAADDRGPGLQMRWHWGGAPA